MTNLKKIEKMHFRVKMGVKFKIKLKIAFKTINVIHPESLGLQVPALLMTFEVILPTPPQKNRAKFFCIFIWQIVSVNNMKVD